MFDYGIEDPEVRELFEEEISRRWAVGLREKQGCKAEDEEAIG